MRTWLLKARKNLNLTQEEAANIAKISRVQYLRIENGKRNPRYSTAKRIIEGLHLEKYGYEWTKFFEDRG